MPGVAVARLARHVEVAEAARVDRQLTSKLAVPASETRCDPSDTSSPSLPSSQSS